MTLAEEIQKLIKLGKEGEYWDFKQQHHENIAELVHDISCLANVDYAGDRYLIYGVNNKFELVDVTGDANRKNQSNIIDCLRNASFSDGVFPDVLLETLEIDSCKLDVLIIKNKPNKPYFLLKDIQPKQNGKPAKSFTVKAFHIYTRNMDTNTPVNSSANANQITRMWQERFGLTQTPFDRLNIYLTDATGWEQNQEYVFFYKQFPEFTIKEVQSRADGNEGLEWARGEIGYHYESGNSSCMWGVFYHNTKLAECIECNFDGNKKHIVSPDWEAIGSGRLYYYVLDSFRYRFHQFMINQRDGEDYSKKLNKVTGGYFDIPVFKDENQLNDFKKFMLTNVKEVGRPFSDHEAQNKSFYALIEHYNEFINNKVES